MFKKHHNILFEQCFFITFSPESPLSLLFAGCQYRSNLHRSQRSEPQIYLDVQSHRGKLAWFGCPDTQSDVQLISCIAPAYRVSGNILNSPRLSYFFVCNLRLQAKHVQATNQRLKIWFFSASMAKNLIKQDEATQSKLASSTSMLFQ